MASVGKVKHGPKVGIGVGFRNLIERRVVRIDDLVNRRAYARVLDRPSQIPRGLATNDILESVTPRAT